jgi:glycosyltransferase involved in cell wall biosynthesis
MRITFLTPSDNLTGGNRVVATYAAELQRRGHEVRVVSNAPDRPDWREKLRRSRRGDFGWLNPPAPVPGHVALSGVQHTVLDRPRQIVAADLPDADVVIATWWETAVWMQALPASKGRKVHLIQGYEVWLGAETVAKVHAALKLPNRKVAISAGLKAQIEAELGPLGIDVVPNAVDLAVFNAPARPRSQPPVAGFIYSAMAIKGSDVCIAAIDEARRSLPALKVLCFGTEEPSTALPLPAGAEFHLRPGATLLPTLYARCDAWLFGSRLDSFGLPILEAMACRVPVIGVPIGAAPDLLPDGGGTLVPGEDPAAMAAALVALLGGPEAQWQQRAHAAHARAHRYSWADATDRLLALITEAP